MNMVQKTGEVQTFHMKNDHTKLEVFKYCKDGMGVWCRCRGASQAWRSTML